MQKEKVTLFKCEKCEQQFEMKTDMPWSGFKSLQKQDCPYCPGKAYKIDEWTLESALVEIKRLNFVIEQKEHTEKGLIKQIKRLNATALDEKRCKELRIKRMERIYE